MKKSVAQKLVKALRSGEYVQGKYRLVTVDSDGTESFCCLGVLCNLATESGYGEWHDTCYSAEDGSSNMTFLPKGVQKWAGMRSECGILYGYEALSSLNDQGKTFLEIADHIEANYKDL